MASPAPDSGAGRPVSPAESGAVVYYYRAAVIRSNAWRNIVDNTTDWAVASTAGMLSFGIAGSGNRHMILFVAHFFIFMFLMIEARRYSYYTSIDWRVRLIEREYFANMLLGNPAADAGPWKARLAADLIRPHRPLSIWGAMTLRLRRTYIWIFLILTLTWIARVTTYPAPAASLRQLWAQSGFASVPGWLFWFALTGLYVVLLTAVRSLPATRKRLEDEGFSIG
jgi:uncharacterized membrane protein